MFYSHTKLVLIDSSLHILVKKKKVCKDIGIRRNQGQKKRDLHDLGAGNQTATNDTLTISFSVFDCLVTFTSDSTSSVWTLGGGGGAVLGAADVAGVSWE